MFHTFPRFETLPVFQNGCFGDAGSVPQARVNGCEQDLINYYNSLLDAKKKEVELGYSVWQNNENSYTLSLYREVDNDEYRNVIHDQVNKIKTQLSKPNYRLVQDFFGNQFYVKQEIDEQQLRREALANIDMETVNKKFAKKSYQDYKIELSYNGNELVISNEQDGIHKVFDIPNMQDIDISGFEIKASDNGSKYFAVLQLNIILKNLQIKKQEPIFKKEVDNGLDRPIQWPHNQVLQTEKYNQTRRQEQSRAEVQKQDQIRAESQKQNQLRAEVHRQKQLRVESQRQEQLIIEAQRQQQIRAEVEKQEKLKAEAQRKEQSRAIRNAELLEKQKQHRLEEQRQQTLRSKHETALQDAERLASEFAAKQKAQEKRQDDLAKQRQMLEQMFPKVIKVNYSSDSDTEDPHNHAYGIEKDPSLNTDEGIKLRKFVSPPELEEVEDEENNRYKQNLGSSPRSIIEDI